MAGNTSAPNRNWHNERLCMPLGRWPKTIVFYDLEYFHDPLSCEGRKREGYRKLAELWGWTPKQARAVIAEFKTGAHRGRSEGAVRAQSDQGKAAQPATKGAGRAHRGRSEGAPHKVHAPNRLSSLVSTSLSEDPTDPLVAPPGSDDHSPCDDDGCDRPAQLPIPAYVDAWRKRTKDIPKGVTRHDLVAFICRGVDLIAEREPVPTAKAPSAGYGRPLLALWARLDFPALGEGASAPTPGIATLYPMELTALQAIGLLSAACRRCPDPIFRSHVRGFDKLGHCWKDVTPQMVPGVVLRLNPKAGSGGATVEDRLEVALKWAAAGFKTTPDDQPLEGALVPLRRRETPLAELSFSERFAMEQRGK